MTPSEYRVDQLHLTQFSHYRRAQGSLLPHHLTGRQALLKRKAPVVRLAGVVKMKR
jgi:hypothetical protein